MVTCHVRYEIDPAKIDAFEAFARAWMRLVDRHGGTHAAAARIARRVQPSRRLRSVRDAQVWVQPRLFAR